MAPWLALCLLPGSRAPSGHIAEYGQGLLWVETHLWQGRALGIGTCPYRLGSRRSTCVLSRPVLPPVTLERVRELRGRQKQEIMEYENREEKGEEEGAEKKSDIRRGERRSRNNRGR